MKGFEERVVIRVDVKVSGYKQYSLDAKLDTGAMNSCAKHSAIPEYYWKPTKLQFIAINKMLMIIRSMAPDFLIILNGIHTFVNLYSFDTCSYILLGQDFVRRHLPLVVEVSHICLNIQVRTIKIQSKSRYVNRIVDPIPNIFECSLDKLAKINRVIRNAKIQGP